MSARTPGTNFYVYVLLKEDGVTPFYVGKGRGHRWGQHETEAKAGVRGRKFDAMRRVIAVLGYLPKKKLAEGLSESEAFALETHCIVTIGRQDIGAGPLLNMTDGGEGASGHRQTPEDRAKKSAANRTPEMIEFRRAQVEHMKVNTDWLEKLSEGQKRARQDPETAAKLDAIARHNMHSDQSRRKAAASNIKAWADPQKRAQQSVRLREIFKRPGQYEKRVMSGRRSAEVRFARKTLLQLAAII